MCNMPKRVAHYADRWTAIFLLVFFFNFFFFINNPNDGVSRYVVVIGKRLRSRALLPRSLSLCVLY